MSQTATKNQVFRPRPTSESPYSVSRSTVASRGGGTEHVSMARSLRRMKRQLFLLAVQEPPQLSSIGSGGISEATSFESNESSSIP
jgi:hypothetical protein